jgi:hypothetical protein
MLNVVVVGDVVGSRSCWRCLRKSQLPEMSWEVVVVGDVVEQDRSVVEGA